MDVWCAQVRAGAVLFFTTTRRDGKVATLGTTAGFEANCGCRIFGATRALITTGVRAANRTDLSTSKTEKYVHS
jgi:NADP-dependent 3-hydroxy acid dehydrogenase YdfG